MKANHDKCHLLLGRKNCVTMSLNGFEIEILNEKSHSA